MADYEQHYEERQVPLLDSRCIRSVKTDGSCYFVGPLARVNLNLERLQSDRPATWPTRSASPGLARIRSKPSWLAGWNWCTPSRKHSTSCALIDRPSRRESHINTGCNRLAATEAPRGLIYHRYAIGEDGLIVSAKIVPPTSQNQGADRDDLRHWLPRSSTDPNRR